MPKLSVIVPVYNVEKFLSKCIESILAQTFTDLELILIDDGSPDNCPAICDAYSAKDKRVRVIHQSNSGVSSARNKGLDSAKGDYISFVDSDDWLSLDCYERMFESMAHTGAKMAICGFMYVYPDGSMEERRGQGDEELLSNDRVIECLFDIPWSIRCVTCNKIFKRKLLENLRFDENLHCCEDTLFLHKYLILTDSNAVYIKEPLYWNYQRTGSAMHGGLSLEDIEKSLTIHRFIANETATKYPELFDRAFAYYMDSCVWKMNANKTPKSNITTNERQNHNKIIRHIRYRILGEWKCILLCPLIGWKQKIFYFLVGLNIK